MPPPVLNELLPLTVTLVIVNVPPLFSIPAPPPVGALLPLTVLVVTDPTAPIIFCSMPPPPPLPLLPVTTQLVIVRLPPLTMPPPTGSFLLQVRVTFVIFSVSLHGALPTIPRRPPP